MSKQIDQVYRDTFLTPEEIARDTEIREAVQKEFPPSADEVTVVEGRKASESLQEASTTLQKQKAGHYEVLGETLAKFEFFEAGWNPYERYLDVDKVDLILRRKLASGRIKYREVQVKYGKLYDCATGWRKNLFDVTSWRFFRRGEFSTFYERDDYFIAYVLAHPKVGYKGDIFIFPPKEFDQLVEVAIDTGGKKKVYISRSVDKKRWYLRKKSGFNEINADTCVDVTNYHRAFRLLG